MIDPLVVLILTHNEEKHIERAIGSVQEIGCPVFVIDSFSGDDTVLLAEKMGATVLRNAFSSFPAQLNFALGKLKKFKWVFRLDADETISKDLMDFLSKKNFNIDHVNGFAIQRKIKFQGQLVKWGGVANQPVVRLVRVKECSVTDAVMDEKFVARPVVDAPGFILDDNLNSIEFWIKKHVRYAQLEASNYLQFSQDYGDSSRTFSSYDIKKKLYYKLPSSIRPWVYFGYRFLIRGGIFDRGHARSFHLFQGLFYRLLVEHEIKRNVDADPTER